MKVQIKNIEHEQKVSKAGKAYNSCKITIWGKKENKDIFLSGFGDSITKTWNPGDTVEVDISQTENGYYNFRTNEESKPSEDPIIIQLKEISRKLSVLIGEKIAPAEKTIDDVATDFGGEIVDNEPVESHEPPAGTKEINADEIPF